MSIWDKYKDEYPNYIDYPSKRKLKEELLLELETFVGTKKQIQEKEAALLESLNEIYVQKRHAYHLKQQHIMKEYLSEVREHNENEITCWRLSK